jgi:hypothetical protein
MNLFKMFVPSEDDLSHLRGYILMEAEPDGEVHNNMQLVVHGDNPITVTFDTDAIFKEPELRGFKATFEGLPELIKPQPNMSTTIWADFTELVAKKEIAVTKSGEDASEEFLKITEALRKKNYKHGAVLRWAFRALNGQSVAVCLQALPASLVHMQTRAMFNLDNCPAVLLSTIPVDMPMSRTAWVVGPEPTLFTSSPDNTVESLRQDHTPALKGK